MWGRGKLKVMNCRSSQAGVRAAESQEQTATSQHACPWLFLNTVGYCLSHMIYSDLCLMRYSWGGGWVFCRERNTQHGVASMTCRMAVKVTLM